MAARHEVYVSEVMAKHDGAFCLIWPFTRNTTGYGFLYRNSKRTSAHRVACEIENGPPPTPKHEAAHSCGCGHLGCVSPKHLSWKTRAENAADAMVHGTAPQGAKHGCAVLSERDVHLIRLLKGRGNSRDISELFGVSRSTVQHIHLGRKWPHLPVVADSDLDCEASKLAARIQEKKAARAAR
jgi:hypothetical protein